MFFINGTSIVQEDKKLKKIKMKTLSSFLFWVGILSIPISLAFWFMEPIFDYEKIAAISDNSLREAFYLASSQRLSIFIGLWAPTLFVLSYIIDQRRTMQEIRVNQFMEQEKRRESELEARKEKIIQDKKTKEKEPVEIF